MEDVTNNLLKEMISLSTHLNDKNKDYPKSDSLNINANVELFDIYNNLEKTFNIKRLRKCDFCLGVGFNLDQKFARCLNCNGKKYIEKNIELKFSCKFKNITYQNMSNEIEKHTPGNIYLNIIPKELRGYKIINNLDLLYIHHIDNSVKTLHPYKFTLKHFDNVNYTISVPKLIINKEYIIEEMGLYNYNNNKRNNLHILFLYENNDICENKISMTPN